MALSRLAPALPLARRLASVALSRGGTTAGVRLSAVFTSVGATRRSHHNFPGSLDWTVSDRYLALDTGDKCVATYIWVDATGEHVRTKARTLDSVPSSASDLPQWSFDGSSTGQAKGHDSDVLLKPVTIFRDPMLQAPSILVLCETLDKNEVPHSTNKRHCCSKVMERVKDSEAWFAYEQEYTLLDCDGHPFGWPKGGYPGPQGPYYCAVGANRVFGRQICDAHLKACMYAGINITGTNAEVMPGQWEYQVGPCEGIAMADHVWVSRYLLDRVAEDFGVVVTLDPKPMPGDWNGAGGHCNFSTKEMREDGGMKAIEAAIGRIEKKHREHIKLYDPSGGVDNSRRLTGLHETASIDEFLWGVAHRGASIRVTRGVAKAGKGYLEDRRPSSNSDPYLVSEALVRTAVLDDWSDFDWSKIPSTD